MTVVVTMVVIRCDGGGDVRKAVVTMMKVIWGRLLILM